MRLSGVAAVGGVVLLAHSFGAMAVTYEVDCTGGGDYLTVQEAVDAAASGDTLLIAPCVYEEAVAITGKSLTLLGGGADVTELRSSGSAAALVFDDGLNNDGLLLRDLSVTRVPDDQTAIRWHGGELTLQQSAVSGGVTYGTMEHATASVDLSGSTVTRLRVAGGQRTSTVQESHVGQAEFAGGGFMAPGHVLFLSGSSIGDLTIYDCQAHSDGDSIGTARVYGGMDVWGEFHAEGSSVEHFVAYNHAATSLLACRVGALDYLWDDYLTPDLLMTGTLVSGPFTLGPGYPMEESPREPELPVAREIGGILVRHNTFLGTFDYTLPSCQPWCRFRSNIVLGSASFQTESCAVITHNDFAGGVSISTPGDSVYLNIDDPPLFCDMAASDYALEDCSPCVGSAHDGGDIGAFGIGCLCSGSAVEESTWGAIKAMYRQLSN
jgi:hypothetical protein